MVIFEDLAKCMCGASLERENLSTLRPMSLLWIFGLRVNVILDSQPAAPSPSIFPGFSLPGGSKIERHVNTFSCRQNWTGRRAVGDWSSS